MKFKLPLQLLPTVLAGIVFLLIFPTRVNAANWYVDNQASGSNNGTSWQNAWENLNAINFGSINSGDTLFLSGGTTSKVYAGTIIIPSGTSGVTITKGVDLDHNGEVILNGSGVQNGILINARNPAVSNLLVSDLTFREYSHAGVYGDGEGSGGLHNIIIDNCKFINFKRSGVFFEGNGYVNNNYNLVVRNSYFNDADENLYTSQSDAIFAQVLKDFTADHNYIVLDNNYLGTTDLHSDNIQTFWVDNVLYANNTIIQENEKTLGTQLLFTENANTGGSHVFLNNVFVRNCPNALDSAIRIKSYDVNTHHTKIIGNTFYGGGIIVNSSISTDINNNIFYGIGQASPAEFIKNTGSNSSVSNNIFYDSNNKFPGESGGADIDPDFANAAFNNPDFHLRTSSPAINTGLNLDSSFLGISFAIDIEGNNRGDAWDIGAYEFSSNLPSPTPRPCQGDLNQDSQVNIIDLRSLLFAWGPASDNPEDLNSDGQINTLDLITILKNWGVCP